MISIVISFLTGIYYAQANSAVQEGILIAQSEGEDELLMDDGESKEESVAPGKAEKAKSKKAKTKLELLQEEIEKEAAAKKAKQAAPPTVEPTPAPPASPASADTSTPPPPPAAPDSAAPAVDSAPAAAAGEKAESKFRTTKMACDIVDKPEAGAGKLSKTGKGKKIWTESAGSEWVKVKLKSGEGFIPLSCF